MHKRLICFFLAAVLCAGALTGCTVRPDPTLPPTTTGPNVTVPETSAPTEPSVPATGVPETLPVTEPTTAPTDPIMPTEPSKPTEPATEPTQPATQPSTEPTVPEDYSQMIGSLYTRGQLMAMENEKKAFGCGIAQNGQIAPNSKACQAQYGAFNAYFYNPNSTSLFLTFDCGYEYSYVDSSGKTIRVTEQILDVLKEKNVKGVFFVTMHYVKSCPDLVQRMIEEGHTVGNHTANHPALPSCSVDKMVTEIMSLHQYVQEHFGYSMNLLRPPEGAFSTRSLALTQSLGYTTVDWSFAHADWDPENQPSYETALNTILSRVHPGAIYLLHAVSPTNAAVLPEAIDRLRAMGYSFDLLSV